MTFASYPNNDQLYGTMIPFGEYQLSYLPPEKGIEGRITMSISSEANLNQMLEIFLNFLRASGYCISSTATLEINDNEPVSFSSERLESLYSPSLWSKDVPNFTDNGLWGNGYRTFPSAASNDTITF